MIELLILYVVNDREKTIYSIRKTIIELFGAFTKPSLGTIHPAVKRLLSKKCVQLTERMSDGGKKSSYYIITETGRKYFKDLYFTESSENPAMFYGQLQAKFGTMGMLSSAEKLKFLNGIERRLELLKYDIENRLKDEYLHMDKFQSSLLKAMLKEIDLITDLVKTLRTE